jgi:autotransporter-associated beta strand protein/T5SS/PEP-CTERM-associated repeat protein
VSVRAEDNTTTIISGVVSNNSGVTYTVGSTGTNNYLQIDSGGQLTNITDAVIGNAATANGNSALVTGTNSSLFGPSNGRLFIGNTGSRNSLTVSNGAIVSGGNRVFLAGAIGSSSNSALVTGPGSVLQVYASVSQNFFVGRLGGNNSLTVSNGGAALGNPDTGFLCELIIGGGNIGTSNNTALITGPGSIWHGNSTLQVGAGPGSGNRLIITNGGQVIFGTHGFIGFDGTGVGISNSVLVTGPGSLLQGGLDSEINYVLSVGYTSRGNTLTISNGGTVSNTLGYIGQFAAGNSARVTGAGSSWQNLRDVAVGYGATATGGGNSLEISSGGAVTNGAEAFIGFHSGTNQALVTGAGSIWQSYSNLWLGFDPNMGNNGLTISNGGAVYGTRILIGGLGGSNTVLVTGPGSVLSANDQVDVGQYSTGNTLTIANGGLVEAGFIAMNYNSSLLNIGDGTAQAKVSVLNVTTAYADDRLNFNAGMLSATADVPNLIGGPGSAYIQSGGAVLDSQSFTVTIPVALLADGGSPGGGLTKTGTGTLTLGGANTYTGNTTVNGGTLVIQQPTLFTNSSITVANGSVLDLAFAGSETNQVGALVLNGVQKAAGVYNNSTDPTYLHGAGSLLVTSSVAATPTNITYSVSGNVLTLAWPESYRGWFAQSNSVSLASPSSWFDISGSQTTTNLSITINPLLPQVFYRMHRSQ